MTEDYCKTVRNSVFGSSSVSLVPKFRVVQYLPDQPPMLALIRGLF